MNKENIFAGIDDKEIDKMLRNSEFIKICYDKNQTIDTTINRIKMIGIIISGTANIEKYDYNGNRSILEKLETNSIFGDIFFSKFNDVSMIATSKVEVLYLKYDNILSIKNNKFLSNFFKLFEKKIISLNEKVEILSKRTIKDKLLTYFKYLSNNKTNKTIVIPFTYTELADYLSVDRSAMMRSLKKLQENGFITINRKKITIINF